MSRPKVIDALNRLLAIQRFSLANYVHEAPAWTHPGNEALAEAVRTIVDNHKHYSQRLAEAIEDRHGVVNPSSFPIKLMSLNDLALDYLLARLVENQQRNILVNERCAAKLAEDPQAWCLATEVLGSARAHLDILKEFLPPGEGIPKGDKIHSRIA